MKILFFLISLAGYLSEIASAWYHNIPLIIIGILVSAVSDIILVKLKMEDSRYQTLEDYVCLK